MAKILSEVLKVVFGKCSRKCSGQSTLEPFSTKAFNSIVATHSIESWSVRLALFQCLFSTGTKRAGHSTHDVISFTCV